MDAAMWRTGIGASISQTFASLAANADEAGEPPSDYLLHASSLLRAIVDTSPFATMAFDRRRRLVLWNPAAERIFGWTEREVIGKPFPSQAIPKEDRPSSSARIARTLGG